MTETPGPHHGTLETLSGLRSYLLYLPRNYSQQRTHPLLLLLHGTGGTASWTLSETRWDRQADEFNFLLLIPDGSRADPHQPPGFLRNPQVWNDGFDRPGLGNPEIDDVGFLNALLDHITAQHAVNPFRIYATGFSNGAAMTFRLGAELASRFAAIAPIAGLCPPLPRKPAVSLRTLYMIGTRDPLLPLEGGEVRLPWSETIIQRPPVRESLKRWAAAIGCTPEPQRGEDREGVRITYHRDYQDRELMVVYELEGLGHHWPGGQGGVSRRLAGNPQSPLEANPVIWDFFCQ